jgi:hypothetical protein
LNYFLLLNKNYLLLFIIFLLIAIAFVFLKKNNIMIINESKNFRVENSEYDILNPNFVINKTKEQIKVTANEGNFINDNEILLTNNVIFKSDKFKILSDDVLFNKTKQTARSNNDSLFFSKKTVIKSEGFKMLEQGDKIVFNGRTTLMLDK